MLLGELLFKGVCAMGEKECFLPVRSVRHRIQ